MKRTAKNSFSEGLVLGVDPSLQKETTLSGGSDVRLITRDNNSFVVTNLKGTEIAGMLPVGFVHVASRVYNGIAYIISAEVLNGAPTGRGEIGSFPSPDYTKQNGELLNQYAPLRNYAGDNNEFPQKNGPFRSMLFNFNLDNPFSIQLQPDYDGTVNIIFTDGRNPIRIVNSGFSVLPGNEFKIIDRIGTKDTNRYDKSNFSNIINLISRSNKILKINFEGVDGGGSLKGGNYQYYFKYATMDGNETEVVGQSFTVSVFHGNTVATIRGSKGEGENTDKRVRFVLSNLDQAYKYVNVYFVFTAGDIQEIKSAFRINSNYLINGDELEFVHTGLEDLERIDIADLSVDYSAVETVKDITQADGYLIASNIKEKDYNRTVLESFARKIKLGHKEQKIDIIGTGDLSRVYNEQLLNSIKPGTDGWNGAYYNPYNIYHRLGYHGGEAYPFAVAFVFPDGSLSKPFPCAGVDNVNNQNQVPNLSPAQIESMVDNNGFLQGNNNLVNINGIYRFPNRNALGVGNILDGTNITVNGVTFEIPQLSDQDYINIKEETIGVVFMRAERKADKITQGCIINTMPVPNVRYTENATDRQALYDYMSNAGGYTEDNCMFIPVFDYLLESVREYASLNDGTRSEDSGTQGIQPVRFGLLNRQLFKDRKFAFLSHDVFTDKQKYLQILNNRDIVLQPIKSLRFQYRVPTLNIYNGASPRYFSLIQQIQSNSTSVTQKTGKSSWVEGFNDLRNNDIFSGSAYFGAKFNSGDGTWGMFPVDYNDYIGLTLDASIAIGTPGGNNRSGDTITGSMIDNIVSNASLLVNLYPSSGQRTTSILRSVYGNIDSNIYTPVSERMTWDELETKLDANRRITCFNGDCFIGVGYRRLFYNKIEKQSTEDNRRSLANIGYTISFVSEADNNIAFRGLEKFDINEPRDRSFAPYYTKTGNPTNEYGEDNSWRMLRQQESSSYNKGYSKVFQDRQYITLPQGVPYLGSKYFTRLMWVGRHIPNSFENAYRIWTGLNFQDYPTAYGQIVGIEGMGNLLAVIFEHGIGILGINERVQTGTDSAGPVFLESANVLSPHIRMISEKIGSKFRNSIKATDNTVYGVDADQSVVWQIAGDQIQDISKFSIEPYLIRYAKYYKGRTSRVLDCDITTSWDSVNHEVLFSFYRKGGSQNESFTFPYNEIGKFFAPKYTHVPYASFGINGRFYSFDSKGSHNVFRLHDSESEAAHRHPCKIRFTVNVDYDISKIFDNLQLVSNNVLPTKIRYYVQGAYSEQVIVYDKTKIYLSNAKYRDEKVEVSIPSVKVITDQDPTEYFPSDSDNAISSIQIGSRFRGKMMVVELEYDTTKQLRLSSVLTTYRQ